MKLLKVIAAVALLSTPAMAKDENYLIETMRAAPGKLEKVIKDLKSIDWVAVKIPKPLIMRHSQGDQWDIMLVGPADYPRCGDDQACLKEYEKIVDMVKQDLDFFHGFTASSSTSWEAIKERNKDTGLYHIEMFHAAAGKHNELLKQRKMENDYLVAAGVEANFIFKTTFGSDVDSFTLGMHKDLTSFAYWPDGPNEKFEKLAKDAGFKNRADISYYLRSLIISHHDTLATKVD